jgi:uncharacterized membrane protein YpjA
VKGYRLLLALVMVVNLFGVVFGFYYYQDFLASSPLWAMPFIPDSPLSTFLFALSIFLLLIGRKSDVLTALASVYVMKYGLWTMFVILYYSYYFLSPALADYYWLMFVLHFGMVIEPVLILHTIRRRRRVFFVPLAWLLLNDIIDYLWDTNPLVQFSLPDLGLVGLLSAAGTIILSFIVYALAGNAITARIWGLDKY